MLLFVVVVVVVVLLLLLLLLLLRLLFLPLPLPLLLLLLILRKIINNLSKYQVNCLLSPADAGLWIFATPLGPPGIWFGPAGLQDCGSLKHRLAPQRRLVLQCRLDFHDFTTACVFSRESKF